MHSNSEGNERQRRGVLLCKSVNVYPERMRTIFCFLLPRMPCHPLLHCLTLPCPCSVKHQCDHSPYDKTCVGKKRDNLGQVILTVLHYCHSPSTFRRMSHILMLFRGDRDDQRHNLDRLV